MHTSEDKYNSVKSMLALSEEYTHDEWRGRVGGGGNLRRWGFFCPCLDTEVNVPLQQGEICKIICLQVNGGHDM